VVEGRHLELDGDQPQLLDRSRATAVAVADEGDRLRMLVTTRRTRVVFLSLAAIVSLRAGSRLLLAPLQNAHTLPIGSLRAYDVGCRKARRVLVGLYRKAQSEGPDVYVASFHCTAISGGVVCRRGGEKLRLGRLLRASAGRRTNDPVFAAKPVGPTGARKITPTGRVTAYIPTAGNDLAGREIPAGVGRGSTPIRPSSGGRSVEAPARRAG
jgi:hypothetical protein